MNPLKPPFTPGIKAEDPARHILDCEWREPCQRVCRCIEPLPLPHEDTRRQCSFLHEWPLVAIVTNASSSEEGAEGGHQSPGLPVSQL